MGNIAAVPHTKLNTRRRPTNPRMDTMHHIAYIYKNKGEIHECENYRPICLTQIAYKIWPELHKERLGKILHLATATSEYGYKQGRSTHGAIHRAEQFTQEGTKTHKSFSRTSPKPLIRSIERYSGQHDTRKDYR